MMDIRSAIAPLFSNWNETLIRSCLQGHMGTVLADDTENLRAAMLTIGDFCFFAGVPSRTLVEKATAPIMIARDAAWEALIEAVWQEQVFKTERYAIKKETDIFDIEKLTAYTNALEKDYTLCLMEKETYEIAMAQEWSRDLCAQFRDFDDYQERGVGVVALYRGELVAGASSYVVCDDGIEIEIDTKREFRRKGLATACGAGLILECLKRGLYPSWDAFDLRSVLLAEKLGYHREGPYPVYIRKNTLPNHDA